MANEIAWKGDVQQFDKVRFELGPVIREPGLMERFGQEFIDQSLQRHCRGDWGAVDELTRRRNERVMERNTLWVESIYRGKDESRLLIVTILDGATTFAVTMADVE